MNAIAPNLRDAAAIKLELLSFGVRVPNQHPLPLIGNYKENNYGYNSANRSRDKALLRLLPSELILGGEIVCSFRLNPQSPWMLREIDGDLALHHDSGRTYSPVSLPPRPQFWNKVTTAGRSMKDIGGVYGLDTIVFFLTAGCEFFEHKVHCKFCSVNHVGKGLKFSTGAKGIGDVAETFFAARREGFRFTNFIGGSSLDNDAEFLGYLPYVRACRETVASKDPIEGSIISMPPQNFAHLAVGKAAGIRAVKFNLEVFDRDKFSKLMPGKAAYGQGRMIEALREAVQVFGRGNVYSNLLIGLEPVESAIAGFHFLAELGVVPVGKTFHSDLGTELKDQSPFSPDQLLLAFRGLNEACRLGGHMPWLSQSSLRGSLAWEFQRGLLS